MQLFIQHMENLSIWCTYKTFLTIQPKNSLSIFCTEKYVCPYNIYTTCPYVLYKKVFSIHHMENMSICCMGKYFMSIHHIYKLYICCMDKTFLSIQHIENFSICRKISYCIFHTYNKILIIITINYLYIFMQYLNIKQNSIFTLINSVYIKSEQLLLLFRYFQVFTLLIKNFNDESSIINKEHNLSPQLHQ